MNEFLSLPPLLPPYDSCDGCTMHVYPCDKAETYRACLQELTKQGFCLYAETALAGNLSATLLNERLLLQVSYTPSDGRLRLAADEKTARYPCAPEERVPVCGTTLWQFETDHSLIDCGMCYIVQCDDGSFFLIDSAHAYSVHDNERIYDFLKKHTPAGQQTVIAGWFLSHGHVDHTAKFLDFLRYNSDDVRIERIYYDFPRTTHPDHVFWMESDRRFAENFHSVLCQFPSIPVVRPHTGQRFYVRNLAFTVLCTHEDVYPGSLANYNDSSTVLLCEAAGSRILFPGDAGALESDILTSRYGEALRCDILQAAHHGHFGTTPQFYRLCAAPVILFPTTQIKFDEEYGRYEANRVAVGIAGESYLSANGTAQFSLPYKAGSCRLLPDETFESFSGIYNLWGYEYSPQQKKELYDAYLARRGKPLD